MTARVVVITGASAGVGRATARMFGAEGARVGLIARDEEGLAHAAREVVEAGGTAFPVVCDVADAEAVEAAAVAIEGALGPIDVWVNNAMVTVFSPVADLAAEEVRRVTEVTYLGYVHGTLTALKRMKRRDAGVIVQVGSALAYRAIPLQAAYCGAKHAIKGFTEALRCELLHDKSGVRVTQVHLPAINTPQHEVNRSHMANEAQPVPPIYQPEVAARAVTWAARHPRREVWVGWPTMKTILGERAFPALLDRYLAKEGYRGQLLPERADPNKPDNLFAPLPGDQGAHGAFDAKASKASPALWLTTHPKLATAIGVGLAGAAALLARRRAA